MSKVKAEMRVDDISIEITVSAEDVVTALNDNDESVLAFVVEMLEAAESSDLRERLAERLRTWEEDRKGEES